MGWEEFMVVSEYDGEHHQTSRPQYVKDIKSLRKARALGWIVDQVVNEDRPAEIVERAGGVGVTRLAALVREIALIVRLRLELSRNNCGLALRDRVGPR
jgi:hypoxanthine-guanine phosphoribosyltransferase